MVRTTENSELSPADALRAGEYADTNITVGTGGGEPPPPPEFRLPERPVPPPPSPEAPEPLQPRQGGEGESDWPFERRRREESGPATERTVRTTSTQQPRETITTRSDYVPGKPHTDTVTTRTHIPNQPETGGVTTKTRRHLHWGSVVKGAVIVAAVALVAVVAISVVPTLFAGAVEGLGLGGVVNTVASGIGSAATFAADWILTGAQFVINFASGIFTGLFGSFSLGLSGGAAAGATVAPAVSAGAGAVVAGGALAVGVPLAAKSLMAGPTADLMQTSTATVTHPQPVPETHIQTTHSAPTPDTSTHTRVSSTGAEAHDLSDDVAMQHHQAASMKAATKIAHHAVHESDSGHEHAEHPPEIHEPQRRVRSALSHSARTSQAWADRVATGHAGTAVTARQNSFADQIDHDRVALESALERN